MVEYMAGFSGLRLGVNGCVDRLFFGVSDFVTIGMDELVCTLMFTGGF